MSWIKNSTFVNEHSKLLNHGQGGYDPIACFNSFRKHWQQISDIIEVTQDLEAEIKHDDILAVVSNLDFMIRLLLLEFQSSCTSFMSLDYVINENILEIFFNWSLHTGKYVMKIKIDLS